MVDHLVWIFSAMTPPPPYPICYPACNTHIRIPYDWSTLHWPRCLHIWSGTSLTLDIYVHCCTWSIKNREQSCHIYIYLRLHFRIVLFLSQVFLWCWRCFVPIICSRYFCECFTLQDRWGWFFTNWKNWKRLVLWEKRCARGRWLGFGRLYLSLWWLLCSTKSQRS